MMLSLLLLNPIIKICELLLFGRSAAGRIEQPYQLSIDAKLDVVFRTVGCCTLALVSLMVHLSYPS